MNKLVIILFVLMSYTGISIAKIGKAMLTPFHACMGMMIAYIFLFEKKGKYNIQTSLLALIGYIVFINALNFPNTRVTSVIYTVTFSVEYLILTQLLLKVEQQTILKAITIIMFSYMVNVLIGFLLSTIHSEFGQGIINVHYSAAEESGRPMGFSSEPSYGAFILSIIYMAFNHLRGHLKDKLLLQVTIAYLVTIVFMKSAYGFIFVAVNALDWFLIIFKKLRFNIKIIFLLFGLGFLISVPLLLKNSDQETVIRLQAVTEVLSDPGLDTKDKMKKLQAADGSAYARIGPTYMLFSAKDEININLWFGAGAGAAGNFLAKFLSGVLVDDAEKVDTGIIPAFIFDYGIIGSILLILFFISCAYNLPAPFWICMLLILPNCNINTQIFWFALTTFSYVSLKKKSKIN
ncbi:MAG: hypothetical protein NXI23_26515 [Bacteroidetes bacterium]|nr:hypothetical protein [Bacteroidota bacterium]